MKSRKLISVCLSLVLAMVLLSACGGGAAAANSVRSSTSSAKSSSASSSDEIPETIKLGFINPSTGVLAGMGEGTPWVEEHVIDYVNNTFGGVYLSEYDKTLPLEMILYDSESDVTKCTELTQKLIEDDKVDIVFGRHTPETVNPVSAVCERYEQPALMCDAPVNAWLEEGKHEWTFHGHWNLDAIYGCYESLWTKAGFPPDSGAVVGMFIANDADGTSWGNYYCPAIEAAGYTLIDPGRFPAGTQDFTEIILQFKAAGVQILTGTATNSDFSTLWRQCKQMDFQPEFITMGKGCLLMSDAMAIGPDLMDGVTIEVYWSPDHPWKSALTGETPADVAKAYEEATGRQISQPMGGKYYTLEVAIDALERAGSLDKTKIRDALRETDLDTIYGHVKYDEDHAWGTILVGGQWVKNDAGELELLIVDSAVFPEIPETGTIKLLEK